MDVECPNPRRPPPQNRSRITTTSASDQCTNGSAPNSEANTARIEIGIGTPGSGPGPGTEDSSSSSPLSVQSQSEVQPRPQPQIQPNIGSCNESAESTLWPGPGDLRTTMPRSPSALSLAEALEKRTQRTYRYGIGLVCIGATLNWLGFTQGQGSIDPLRYLGMACVICGSFSVCTAMCRWFRKPFYFSPNRRANRSGDDSSDYHLRTQDNVDVHVITLSIPINSATTTYPYPKEFSPGTKPPDYDSVIATPTEPPSYDEAIKIFPVAGSGAGAGSLLLKNNENTNETSTTTLIPQTSRPMPGKIAIIANSDFDPDPDPDKRIQQPHGPPETAETSRSRSHGLDICQSQRPRRASNSSSSFGTINTQVETRRAQSVERTEPKFSRK